MWNKLKSINKIFVLHHTKPYISETPTLVWVLIHQISGIILIDRKHGTIPIPNNDDTAFALLRHPELTTGYVIRRIKDDKKRYGLCIEHYQKSKIIREKTTVFYLSKRIEDEEFEDLTVEKLESVGIKIQPSKSKCSECDKFLRKYEEVKNIVGSSEILISTLGRILSEKDNYTCHPICPYHNNNNWDRVKAFSSHLEESGKGISTFVLPYFVELELYE